MPSVRRGGCRPSGPLRTLNSLSFRVQGIGSERRIATDMRARTVLRPTALAALIGLVATFAVLPPATASTRRSQAGCSASVLVLRALNVEATTSKKVVKPGDRFTVDVKVTRPAHEDPLGQGIEFTPPASVPAENVTLGISVWVGKRTYFWQVGISDANGEDTLTLKVPANAETGEALASVSARRWIKQDCPDILEDGYATYSPFVVVKK